VETLTEAIGRSRSVGLACLCFASAEMEKCHLYSAIGYVTPADKMVGRAEVIWAACGEKPATASARRRAKTEEKEIAQPQSSEVH
jgi:hypothetical protein